VKEEPVDILDELGHKTGQTMLKSKAHHESQWHAVAHLWIYNSKAEVLLQKRAPNKIVWPNVWDVAVAGHITAGDDPEPTIIREAKEEIGLKIDPRDVHFYDLSKFDDEMPQGWSNRVYIHSYLTKNDIEISDLTLEEEETSDVRWVKIDKLEKELDEKPYLFSPAGRKFFRIAIKEIRQRLSG
jgi:isopentenyl-diphosphate Delta-isomerase